MTHLPKSPQHQRFADLYISMGDASAAYKLAGFKCTDRSAVTGASRLLKSPDVTRYLAHIQQAAEDATVLSLIEKRKFLAKIVRTPLSKLDPTDEDTSLIIKKSTTTDSDTHSTTTIEKLCPLKAIEIDNKLAGDDSESTSLKEIADALRSIASPVIPEDKMPLI